MKVLIENGLLFKEFGIALNNDLGKQISHDLAHQMPSRLLFGLKFRGKARTGRQEYLASNRTRSIPI